MGKRLEGAHWVSLVLAPRGSPMGKRLEGAHWVCLVLAPLMLPQDM